MDTNAEKEIELNGILVKKYAEMGMILVIMNVMTETSNLVTGAVSSVSLRQVINVIKLEVLEPLEMSQQIREQHLLELF